ncbi:MAG: hypothetical protein ACYTJ0_14195 [Planctomycetota bacterium]|jgi:hypothetical protein
MQRLTLGAVALAAVLAPPAFAASVDTVIFMEPVEALPGPRPTYRVIADPERVATFRSWLDNGSARMALELYDRSWRTVLEREGREESAPLYHVALVDGGNHADIGFDLQSAEGITSHPRRSYIKLSPRPSAFENTFLHETGHVVLATLNGGERIPARPLAAIPHTTAALSDRGTAFNEGFAIHLETLAAHVLDDPRVRTIYRHEAFKFGDESWRRNEFYRHATDLRTYAQTVSRYYDVRENNFAFVEAYRGPEYLRVQLEKSRDFATLRDANQLLQSEGYCASFFFSLIARGPARPEQSVIAERHARVLSALAEMFERHELGPDSPFLVHFVETYMAVHPDEAGDIVDVLLETSHGVFVDPDAARLWREAYLAALALDIEGFPPQGLEARREDWRRAVLADPSMLHDRLGPQILCRVPERTVSLVAFGRPMPLSFDVNTVQEGVILMIPGADDALAARWLEERSRRPFADAEDFRRRLGVESPCLEHMAFP